MKNKAEAKIAYQVFVDRYRKYMPEITGNALENLSEFVIGYVKDDTPYVTGTLYHGWRWEVSGLTATWYNDVPYASEVEFNHGGGMLRINTAPHTLGSQMQKFWRSA